MYGIQMMSTVGWIYVKPFRRSRREFESREHAERMAAMAYPTLWPDKVGSLIRVVEIGKEPAE